MRVPAFWKLIMTMAMSLTMVLASSGADAQSEKKSGLRDLVYEEAEPLSAKEIEAVRQKAYAQYKAKNTKEAFALFEQYLSATADLPGANQPQRADAWLHLGYCYKHDGNLTATIEPIERGLAILTKDKGPEALESAQLIAPLILADGLNANGEYQKTISVLETYIPLMSKKVGRNSIVLITSLEVMADSYRGLGQTAEADEASQLAAELREGEKKSTPKAKPKGGQKLKGFDAAYDKADNLYSSGKHAEALKMAQDLDRRLSSLKNPDIEQKLWIARLQQYILSTMGRLEENLKMAETVLELEIQVGGADSPNALLARGNVGVAHSRLGNYEKSYDMEQYVYNAYKKIYGENHEQTLLTGINLVISLKDMNRYGDALDLAAQMAEASRKHLGPKHEQTFRAVNNWSEMLMFVGDYEQAEKILEANLTAARQILKEHPQTYQTVGLLAAAAFNKPDGDRAQGLKYMKENLEYSRRTKGPEHTATLFHELNYARALAIQKNFTEAKERFDDILPRLAKGYGEEHPNYLAALADTGTLNRDLNNLDESCRILQDVLPQIKASGDARLYCHVATNLSKSLRLNNDLESAAFFGQEAVTAGQALRRSLASGPESARKSLAALMTPAYQELADILMAQNKVSEAQKIMELLKIDELADMTATRNSENAPGDDANNLNLLSGVEPETARRYQQISDNLAALGEEQRGLLEKRKSGETLSAKEEQRLKELRQDMTAARKVFSAFVENLSKEMAQSGGAQTADLGNLETYQRLLASMGEGTVLLQTILTDDHLWLILTTPNALVAKESPLDVKTLSAKIGKFRDVLQDPDVDAKPLAKEFYDAVIGPVAESLKQAGAKTIMFSLDGQLRYIPMATLYDGKNWLVQNYRLALFNDATKAGLAVPPVGNWTVAGLGVTKEHKYGKGTFSALSAVKDELAAIVKTKSSKDGVLQGTMTLDEGFTSDTLAEVLEAGFPVVHLASHFHFDAKNPEKSFLLLGDGSGLPLTQIETEDYKFKNVDLLALSACQTARGGVDATGREIEGFGALAQKRGAKAVLATLWPVFDESTGLLMSSFYRIHSDRGKPSIAESLRQAQLMMINNQIKGKDFQHPFYWGPFVLMGDWR